MRCFIPLYSLQCISYIQTPYPNSVSKLRIQTPYPNSVSKLRTRLRGGAEYPATNQNGGGDVVNVSSRCSPSLMIPEPGHDVRKRIQNPNPATMSGNGSRTRTRPRNLISIGIMIRDALFRAYVG